MIRKLAASEFGTRLQSVDRYVDRTKPLYTNPVASPFAVCGAIRGLDVPIRSLASLGLHFAEKVFYVLSQNLEHLEGADLLEVEVCADNDVLTRDLNLQFPGIFAGDLVVCWGESQRWQIVFDAQLALGVLVVRNPHDATKATAAYSEWDELHNIDEAFAECVTYEVQGLPEELRSTISNELCGSWGVPRYTKKQLSSDLFPSAPRG